MHPQFAEICTMFDSPVALHRKLWEWVFIIHHALKTGAVGESKTALAFAVGEEPLPAVFAELAAKVRVTDAPQEVGELGGWFGSGQFATGLAALPTGHLERELFDQRVSFSVCDMNAIDSELKDFDFCWSSCAFEHLGDLRKGMDFVLNSIQTLKIGGVAVHTTELNLSSNNETLTEGNTVLYRRRDLEELVAELRAEGHVVDDFRIAPDSYFMDGFVDVPPYCHNPHLKLEYAGFVTTSVGLVIRRGR